ncbi:MAG: hypothetical protein IT288_11355 [Bdellovibrionales bacterium]|nr:hypothetical protein [Bdellovibrionales bacterium]
MKISANCFTRLALILALVTSGPLAFADQSQPLDLKDLGFTSEDTKASPETQKQLEERRFYLKQHQIWGLVSAGTMALATLSGGEGDLPPEHPYMAGLAFTSYAAAAYTAWAAPELKDEKVKGGSAWHRRLVWIHLPGMILTPILGYMAAKKFEKGEKLDGPEEYHKDLAGITAVSLLISAVTVSFEF